MNVAFEVNYAISHTIRLINTVNLTYCTKSLRLNPDIFHSINNQAMTTHSPQANLSRPSATLVASMVATTTIVNSMLVRLLVYGCLVVCVGGTLTGCVVVQNRPGQSDNPVVLPQDDSAEAKQELEARQARLRADADRRRQQAEQAQEEKSGESSPAVVALRSQAESKSASGDVQTANLLLERALRIDPADSSTYLQLAQLRLENREYTQAAALARRGLSLNPPADTASDLQQVIEQAENQTGSAPAVKTEA